MHLGSHTCNVFAFVGLWLDFGGVRYTDRIARARGGQINPGSFRAKSGMADKIRWYWYPRYVIGTKILPPTCTCRYVHVVFAGGMLLRKSLLVNQLVSLIGLSFLGAGYQQ